MRACSPNRTTASVLAKALENNLMLAMREIELRIPDSGAREAAEQLQARVPASYAAYFAVLDLQASPRSWSVRRARRAVPLAAV